MNKHTLEYLLLAIHSDMHLYTDNMIDGYTDNMIDRYTDKRIDGYTDI